MRHTDGQQIQKMRLAGVRFVFRQHKRIMFEEVTFRGFCPFFPVNIDLLLTAVYWQN